MSKLAAGDKIGSNFPYRVIKQLGKGEGGMSVVYLASINGEIDQPKTSDLVALKIANVKGENRKFYKHTLDNEIEHLRRLQHKSIVRIHAIQGKGLPRNAYSARTSLPDTPWFSVLEYLAGESLAEMLKQQKGNKLDPGLALLITHKLAKALEYVHREGYVHLDMKPENVVFRQKMTGAHAIDPVLVDFGIARAIDQGGLEAGTLIWLPPERVRFLHDRSLPPEAIIKPNPSIDMYALGLILYSMLAGKLPYQGTSKKITAAILKGEPTAPSTYNSDLKPELDQLVLSAIAKNPDDRPSAAQFAQQIETLMNRAEYKEYEVPEVTDPPEGRFFFKLFRSFVLTLTIAIVGLAAYFYLQYGSLEPAFNMLSAPTITPTVAATQAATVTEVLPTTTTAPTASVRPSNTVLPTEEPEAIATAIPTSTVPPTSTPFATFTPAPVQPTSAPVQSTSPPASNP